MPQHKSRREDEDKDMSAFFDILNAIAEITGPPDPQLDSLLGFLIRTSVLPLSNGAGRALRWQLNFDPEHSEFWVTLGDYLHIRGDHSPINALKTYAEFWLNGQKGEWRGDLIQARVPDERLKAEIPTPVGYRLN